MPVDNEAHWPETRDIEVDIMNEDPGVHGVHVVRVVGFTLKEAINVVQWLSQARDEQILTIRSI